MKHVLNTVVAGKLLGVAVAAILVIYALPASANTGSDETLLEGAKLCTQYLPRHERQYGIPVHLLAAIASTESGRYHRSLGLNLPWPWTINVEGRGYFFNTKEEAIAAVQHFQSRGIQSIDVGCMQVNLHHHPTAFASLDQAFDPAYNVAYAAQFLKQNFVDEGSWRKATADYHSHTQMYGDPYARMVYGAWSRIINKVADARAGRIVAVASSGAEPDIRYHDAAAAEAAEAIARAPHASVSDNGYQSPRMHMISVSGTSGRENGVMVIRPDKTAVLAPTSQDQADPFVIHRKSNTSSQDTSDAHAVVQAAQSAKAPITTMADNTANMPSPGAHVITIHASTPSSGSASNGDQLDSSRSSIVRVGDIPASNSAQVGTIQNSSAGHNIFVFDN